MAEPIRIPADLAQRADLTPRRKRIVVGFAGGGGSSLAIAASLGVHPDAAINHWQPAILVHMRNFPDCDHYLADIFDTDPMSVCPGEEIGLAWFSPDCRHHSKAKGCAPVSPRVRGLAWVVIRWAKLRRPDVIFMENVEEWLDWGPLVARDDPDGSGGKLVPDPDRKGETADRWFRRLRACGYQVETRASSAADFGDPTIRKRMLVIARRDGRPIVWPVATHAPRLKAAALHLKPHRAAAEIIDFSRPCPSIFLTRAEARALGVKRPLEEATLRRIARGLLRDTHASADPFIVPVTHRGDDRTHDVRDPLRTMTTAQRGEFALIQPNFVRHPPVGQDGSERPDVTDRSSGHDFEAPILVPHFGERAGQEPRSRDVADPYPTVVPGGRTGDLAVAHLIKLSENSLGQDPRHPLHTVMAGAPRHGVVAAFMEQANTGLVGHDARAPVSTIVGKGSTQRLIAAHLTKFRGGAIGSELGEPMPTVTANSFIKRPGGAAPLGYVAADLETVRDTDQPMAVPFADAEDGRARELRAFLIKYYGAATAEDLADPLATTTSRSRFGLVMVAGTAFRIVDIGMRMLDPETELSAAMGWPRSYVLGEDATGRKVTKTTITKLVGNGVCLAWAAAHIAANCADLPWWGEDEREAA